MSVETERELERRALILFEGISDVVFVNEVTAEDGPGRFLQVNDVACRRLGYTRDELLAMTPRNITSPLAFDRAEHPWRMLVDGGSALFETVHVAKDGRRAIVRLVPRLGG